MSQTHTPGTWADAGMHDVASDLLGYPVRWLQDGNGDQVCLVPVDDESDANAERIVLCCNAHDDLVAALRACAETLRAIRMCYGFGSSKAITPQTQLALEGEIDKSLEPCRAALAALAKAGEK